MRTQNDVTQEPIKSQIVRATANLRTPKLTMSGLNHNHNHIVKRIETRVLAPPGGHSTFSLGWGPSNAAVQSTRRASPASSMPVPQQQRQAQPQSQYKQYQTERAIPGLEAHPQYRQQQRYDDEDEEDEYERENVPQYHHARAAASLAVTLAPPQTVRRGPMTSAEYAHELRMQMAEKYVRDHEQNCERGVNMRRSLSKTAMLEDRMRTLQRLQQQAPAAHPSVAPGKRFASSAGGVNQSSWSISGNY